VSFSSVESPGYELTAAPLWSGKVGTFAHGEIRQWDEEKRQEMNAE